MRAAVVSILYSHMLGWRVVGRAACWGGVILLGVIREPGDSRVYLAPLAKEEDRRHFMGVTAARCSTRARAPHVGRALDDGRYTCDVMLALILRRILWIPMGYLGSCWSAWCMWMVLERKRGGCVAVREATEFVHAR